MRVYLDAAPVIYSIERVPDHGSAVDRMLSVAAVVPVVSDLTRLECRVKPMRDGNIDLLADFDQFFAEAVGETVAPSTEVIERATAIRARYGFKTPDAIHLGAAMVSGCERFLTNDHRLDRFEGIDIVVLQPRTSPE